MIGLLSCVVLAMIAAIAFFQLIIFKAGKHQGV
jgi:hypothetical protein